MLSDLGGMGGRLLLHVDCAQVPKGYIAIRAFDYYQQTFSGAIVDSENRDGASEC